jgi:hypothetical protein
MARSQQGYADTKFSAAGGQWSEQLVWASVYRRIAFAELLDGVLHLLVTTDEVPVLKGELPSSAC